MLTHLDPSNGRFLVRLAMVTAALIIAAVTDGGSQDTLNYVWIGQFLLPPGPNRGPDRPAA